jgi:hypothetical protein
VCIPVVDAKPYTNVVGRYGAVVRGTGAYVPPGARKMPLSPPASGAKLDIPKVAVNAPDGAIVPDKAGSPAPTAANTNKVCIVESLER